MKKTSISLLLLFNISSMNSQDFIWKQMSGPQGGLISTICFTDSIVFAGGINGVFRSTDNGDHWKFTGLASDEVKKIIAIGDTIWAGTDRNGVYISGDQGLTWKKDNNGLPLNVSVVDMAVLDTYIFAATSGYGIFRRSVSDSNWTAVNTGIDNLDFRTIIASDSVIIASAAGASGSGMFRSTNRGELWTRIDPDPYAWMADAICKYHDTLYAARYLNQAEVYISIDDGLTWSVPAGASPPNDIITNLYADHSGLYAGIYNNGIYRSSNSGISWTQINNGLYNYSPTHLNGKDGFVYYASYDGIKITSDFGTTWQQKNLGLTNSSISCINSVGESIFAGTNGAGLFYTTDLGATWNQITDSNVKPFIKSLINVNDTIFLASTDWTYNCRVIMSSDKGISWVQRNNGIDGGDITSIAWANDVLYASTSYGLFKSVNRGAAWTLMTSGLPNSGRPNVASVAAVDSIVVAADGESQIYRSTDLGEHWAAVSMPAGITPPIIKVSAINTTLYAGCSEVNVLFMSSDKGATWQTVGIPEFNGAVEDVTGNDDSLFIAVTYSGVIAKYGISYGTLISSDIMNSDIRSVHYHNGHLWLGSWGAGIFRNIDSSEITYNLSANDLIKIPGSTFLRQNYPNPFNPSTVISYQLPSNTLVKLKVYDELGRLVRTLVNENQNTGEHSVTFNASNLSSGVYFYRLSAGGFVQTKKLMLLK